VPSGWNEQGLASEVRDRSPQDREGDEREAQPSRLEPWGADVEAREGEEDDADQGEDTGHGYGFLSILCV
jgi:hypothetical protein